MTPPWVLLFRMDDICPTMDREWFDRYLDLFRAHGVRPLLGVVPDNRDPDLALQPPDPGFWARLRALRDEGAVDLAQHGYQHLLTDGRPGLLGPSLGFGAWSEFATLPYEEQHARIKAGKALLEAEGVGTDVWMAPAHTYDTQTLRALVDLGFKVVTDGVGLFPVSEHGLLFVPQQLWRPMRLPVGVGTCCIHSNWKDARQLAQVKAYLEAGRPHSSMAEVRRQASPPLAGLANAAFRAGYAQLKRLKAAATAR